MLNIMNPPADWSTLKKLIWLRGAPITGGEELTVSGTPPLSLPNSIGKPLKAWSVDVVPYQEGSGDPSPSNVRAIHGTDKLTVWTSGKNLIKTTGTSKTESEVTWTVNDDGTISVSGTATGYSSFVVGTAKVDSSMGYITISGIGTATNIVWSSVILQDDNDNTVYTITTGSSELSFTVDMSQYPTATKVYVSVKRNNNVATSGVVKPMVELGSTASDYTPYVAPSQTVITIPTLSANQWDEEWEVGTISGADGQNESADNRIRSKNYIPVKYNTQYRIVGTMDLFYYDANKAYIGNVTGASNITFTTTENSAFIRFRLPISYGTTYNHDISINYPSNVTTYNPYNATVYTGTIGSEGGDIKTGKIRITAFSGAWEATNNGFAVFAVVPDGVRTSNQMCDKFKPSSSGYANMPLYSWMGGSGASTTFTFILPSNITSISEANQWIVDNGGYIEFTYQLAESVPIPIASPPIQTPKGTALTWATAENGTVDGMEVTYVGKA